MRSTKVIHIVSCHAEGEVGNVIVGGVAPPPGDSVWEQARWIEDDQALRQFVLNEPRGGVFKHVNLLVPPKNKTAAFGFIIMEPEHTPPMSGSNSICVATVLLDTGLIQMHEPETMFQLEAPAGLVPIKAYCENGKAKSIELQNVPSFADKLGVKLEVPGIGTLTVDTAYGGDSFVLVEAWSLGFEIVPDEARELAEAGAKITAAANEQIGFQHPTQRDWNKISFCQFVMPIERQDGRLNGRNTVAIDPGKLDRSPCGTGCSARMAVLHAKGEMQVGDRFIAESIIGSRFDCTILDRTSLADEVAIIPTIRGRGWITGTHQLMCDPEDPWPGGYRLTDTWPKITVFREAIMDEQVKRALEQGHTIDITTTGRKSGLPRRIEISFQNLAGHLYILGGRPGPRDWLANLRATPDFTFHLKEQVQADLPARARVIDDESERRDIFAKLTSAAGAELEALVEGGPLVEVLLEGDGE